MKNAVAHWFGEDFDKLNPLLRRLHTQGGRLYGKVDITFGTGISGLIGRRIAGKLGIPSQAGKVPFSVEIRHSLETLFWSRTFANGHTMTSEFQPVKTFRQGGYWIESSGPVNIQLGVSIEGGNWQWLQQSVSIFQLPIPTILMPKVSAGKAIIDALYQFEVKMALPVLGFAFGYSGKLLEYAEQA
ncbi:DUF4166 domain-containing protein [uncultured Microbulbifer sp.]|uniref:DUF4166 domain-containing protein n=1 Tax=uncultured Microbulbifer sp. TaxID=348147 RepID=UPI00261F7AD4|nr:DUF4166 domain-containing protein [uncultured Microbulbifer sp.]